MQNLLILTITLILSVSCGNSSSEDNNESQTLKKITQDEKGVATSACDLISETDVKKILSIPADAVSSIKDVVRTYPSCFYEWETVTFPREMSLGDNKFNVDIPAELTLVLVGKATPSMFETASKAYRDGVGVEGVGTHAIWGDLLSQITFLADGIMVHVHVKCSEDVADNKAKAISIAKGIISNL